MEELTYKQATLSDYDDFYKIKCDPENVKWSGFASAPDYERMKEWFCKQLDSEKRLKHTLSISIMWMVLISSLSRRMLSVTIGSMW